MFVELATDWQGCKAGNRIDVSEPDARQLIAAGQAKSVLPNPSESALDAAMESAVKRFGNALAAKLEQFAEALREPAATDAAQSDAAQSSTAPKPGFMTPPVLTQGDLRKLEGQRLDRELAYAAELKSSRLRKARNP